MLKRFKEGQLVKLGNGKVLWEVALIHPAYLFLTEHGKDDAGILQKHRTLKTDKHEKIIRNIQIVKGHHV